MDWQSLYLQAAAANGSGGADGEARLIPMPRPASDRKYVCQTCAMAFPTHYALGGHSKIHRSVSRFPGEKFLHGRISAFHAIGIMMAQQYQRRGGAAVDPGHIPAPPPPPPAARDLIQHPCSRCRLVFSTGKELVDHMRMHLQAERERMEAAAAVASAARPAVRRLDIDLNKPPPME